MPLKDTSNPVIRADWEYYENVVKPLLKHGQVEMIGEVGDAEKPELLGNALALLFPIDWPEPFGLVMAEALACGTPVVARRRGSVPEVITHGLTGLIGETDDELLTLVQNVHTIDRASCREVALERFSPAAMAEGYEAVYAAALAERAEARRTSRPARRPLIDLSPLPADRVRHTPGTHPAPTAVAPETRRAFATGPGA